MKPRYALPLTASLVGLAAFAACSDAPISVPNSLLDAESTEAGPAVNDANFVDTETGDARVSGSDAALGDAALGDAALGDAALGDATLGDAAIGDATASQGPQRTYDLDGDGTFETDLSVSACAAAAGSVCLRVTSSLGLPAEVSLFVSVDPILDACVGVYGRNIHDIGSYFGSSLHEISVVTCPGGKPTLDIVDVAAAAKMASATAPVAKVAAYTDAPRMPDGRRQPFLAASLEIGPSFPWGSISVFRCATGGACGFQATSTAIVAPPPGTSFLPFRQVGGFMQDLDGDQWEDISLYYEGYVHTISGATLAPLATTLFNVTNGTPQELAPPYTWFHGGRNYGMTTALPPQGTTVRTIQIGGSHVGSFADYNCGVSRFAMALESETSSPSLRRLAWSQYYSFGSTILNGQTVVRPADVLDKCVHIPGDGLTKIDGTDAIVYNIFDQSAPIDVCLTEQKAVNANPTDATFAAFYACFAKNVGTGSPVSAAGSWRTVFLRQDTGAAVTGGTGYVWGYSAKILPGGKLTYLVEFPPANARFNLEQGPRSTLVFESAKDGFYVEEGRTASPARPKIRTSQPFGKHGSGGGNLLTELVLEDRDGDGLSEVQLDDGTYVGWSAAAKAIVVKP
jgi:hypothetical protein